MSNTSLHLPGFCLLFLVVPCRDAAAGRRAEQLKTAVDMASERGPATSASEIPALAELLSKAGWQPTPELSGVFEAGAIFEQTAQNHALLATNCIAATPVESTYTSTELVSSLQAGVSVRAGLASVAASGSLVKKVKFGTPVQISVPTLDLFLEDACRRRLERLPKDKLDRAYVVREVLRAEIAEQTCGRLDASGRIVGLGAADAELAAACTQASLEPVAVGYRTVALAELLAMADPTEVTPDEALPIAIGQPTSSGPSLSAPSPAPSPAPGPIGPFALVLAPQAGMCVWSVEDAPSGRSATVFATQDCPDEIAWSGTDDLFFNDADQVYVLRAGETRPAPIGRPSDPRCDAEGGWGRPLPEPDGGLRWECFSESDRQQDLGGGRTRVCSGEICVDDDDGIWALAVAVVVKEYRWTVERGWALERVTADCSGTEGCLVGFDRPSTSLENNVSLSGLIETAQETALACTIPDHLIEDASLQRLMGLDEELGSVCGSPLGAGGFVLWSNFSEAQAAYGPVLVTDASGLRRVPLDVPLGVPLTTSVEAGWAVLDPATEDGEALLVGPVGGPPVRTWPAGTRVLLLPTGAPLPLGVVP